MERASVDVTLGMINTNWTLDGYRTQDAGFGSRADDDKEATPCIQSSLQPTWIELNFHLPFLFLGKPNELMETAYAALLYVKRRFAGNMGRLTETFHVHLHLL